MCIETSFIGDEGLAEPIRLALYLGNIPFEDERLSFEDFLARKATFPFKQLPVLDIDDGTVELTQSGAILRYVGNLVGLYDSKEDPLQAALIDQVLAVIYDMAVAMRPTYAVEEMSAKVALRKEICNNQLTPLLASLDAVLKKYEKNSDLAVGNNLSIADLIIYSQVDVYKSGFFDGIPTNLTEKYPKLCKIYENVSNLEPIKSYYSNRK